MKNILKNAIAGLTFGALALSAQGNDKVQLEGAEIGVWTMDFDAASKLAAEKKVPMMLNFTGSDWCGWCKLMDKNVFAEEEWKKFAAESVVLVTLDFPKDKTIVPEKFVERNEKLKGKFGVRGFPTYVVLDSDAETKLGQLGAGRDKTPTSFVEEFKGVTRLSDSNITAYAKANPEKADAYKAAIAESRASKKALQEWIKTGPEKNDENNKKHAEFTARIKAAEEKVKSF